MSGFRRVFLFAAVTLGVLAATAAAATSSAAQAACTQCPNEQRSDARRELEQATQEFRVALAAYERALEAMARDSSAASRHRLTKTNRDLRVATRRLETISARLTRLESEAVVHRAPSARSRTIARPRAGYMGVNLSAALSTKRGSDGQTYWEFGQYPLVESVEPGSPAERAGLIAGDVMVALDNQDLTESVVPFGRLLVPGKRLAVRVRRAGETKSFTLVVDERPVRRIMIAPQPDPNVDPDADPYVEVIPAPPTPRTAATPRTPRNAPTPTTAPMAPMPPLLLEWHENQSVALAGASLVSIKGDLREYFGVDRGALITQVAAGTPASRAGLKGGDVIVSAAGNSVRTPHDVQMALAEASPKRVMTVEIIRKKEKRAITIRW